ncbi:MAG: class I SAM-dependent methyltransferase [Thermomicrobiales bacterium]
MTDRDPETTDKNSATGSPAADHPSSWFEPLYAAAAHGSGVVPWDRKAPHQLLVEWATQRHLSGRGKRALIVGSGFGENAEYVASLGFDTVAFDISETAILTARERFPNSSVAYETADLFDPPADWKEHFDLVVEIYTVQALPESFHQQASHQIGTMVAPGGTLIVIMAARDDADERQGPPWPLRRGEIDAFATSGLHMVGVEDLQTGEQPFLRYWRAEFTCP